MNEINFSDVCAAVLERGGEVELLKQNRDKPLKPGPELRAVTTSEHDDEVDKATGTNGNVFLSEQGSGYILNSTLI